MKTYRLCLALIVLVWSRLAAETQDTTSTTHQSDSLELKRIFDEDQGDRTPPIDWSVVSPRDEARRVRVKDWLAAGALHTGADYFHAGMVLQHSPEPDDHLLCHDLCVIAIGLGEARAKWLAAASLDRFLMGIGRPQRFGTQYRSLGLDQPMKLHPVDPSVSDELRRAFDVPPLAEAKAKEIQMQKQSETPKSPQ